MFETLRGAGDEIAEGYESRNFSSVARRLGEFQRLADRTDRESIEAMIEETKKDQAAHK